MARRWNDPAAFRADPAAAESNRPTPRQALALVAVVTVVAGAIAALSYLIQPERARSFDLFRGSLFLADDLSPVSVDLASGKPTVRLVSANEQVSARTSAQLSIVNLGDSSLLLNNATGEFNLVDTTGFVMKQGGGVPLAAKPGATSAMAVAAGPDTVSGAYVLQTGPTGTSVYLVNRATIARAALPRARATPSAFRSIPETVGTGPGTAATGPGQALWVLAGSGARRSVLQLGVPVGGRLGATLTRTRHGSVPPVSALGTSTDAGAVTVGVASADRIQLYTAGRQTPRIVRFAPPAGVTAILPATNGQGRLSFLLHGAAGWSVVSVGADGSGLRRPTRLTAIDPGARLAQPAQSSGALYTINRIDGRLWRVSTDGIADPVTGISDYPLLVNEGQRVEQGGLNDAYVVAVGPRVFVNSPRHVYAVALFTDGSHDALRIDKNTAVNVSAKSTVDTLSQGRTRQQGKGTPPRGQPKPRTPAPAPVNNKIDCKSVTKSPNVPSLGQISPGSRSVQLSWNYATSTKQDCVPSTYQLTLKVLSGSAPNLQGIPPVQGQREVNLAGLFPSTRYEVTVTAYINGRGTTSPPRRFTTQPEGPAAPRNVRVATDQSGTWTVTWASCGTVKQGCVPADSWRAVPRLCDARGLSGAPAPITVPADPASTSQPPARLSGGDALLGRGVSFQVEGTGQSGIVGTPSAGTACVTSWAPPVAGGLKLAATIPSTAIGLGSTTTASVSLDLGARPTRDVGGVGARITLRLTGPNGYSRTQASTYAGTTSVATTTFDGVQPGGVYTATAQVSPPGHPAAAVTVGPQTIRPTAAWPALGLDASCDPGPGVIKVTCDLHVRISGVSSAGAKGERFDVIDSADGNSQIRCGNAATNLDRSDIDPVNGITVSNLPLLTYSGTCTVSVVLRETSATPPPGLFGGQPSALATRTFTIGQPTTYTATQSDFTAAWEQPSLSSQVRVRYVGQRYSDSELARLTANWVETIRSPDGTACGTSTQQPSSLGILVTADPSCVNDSGAQTGWTLTISFDDAGTTTTHTLDPYQLTGTPPGYQQCAPVGFQASWGLVQAEGVTVTYTNPDPTLIAGCSNFRYTLLDETDKTCGNPDANPNPPAPSVIPVSGGCTPAPGWRVHITWTQTDGKTQGSLNPDLTLGDPPAN